MKWTILPTAVDDDDAIFCSGVLHTAQNTRSNEIVFCWIEIMDLTIRFIIKQWLLYFHGNKRIGGVGVSNFKVSHKLVGDLL